MLIRGVLPVSEGESLYILNLYVCRRESIRQLGPAVLDLLQFCYRGRVDMFSGSS